MYLGNHGLSTKVISGRPSEVDYPRAGCPLETTPYGPILTEIYPGSLSRRKNLW